MNERSSALVEFLREHGRLLAAGAVLLALMFLGVRWVRKDEGRPAPRKVMQFSVVNVQPPPPPKTPPPAPPPPTKVEEPPTQRVDLKPADLLPPDAPRSASSPPAAGPLALATEGEGPGDAFNLAGNPGGRGLLGSGGDGTGDGLGGGGGGSRFGWYYAKVATQLEDAFRHHKQMSTASTRVELRIWADPSGRITRVQLLRSTGDLKVDEAIQSVVGLKLSEPPPPDIPMPMVARLTARRPE